MAEPVEWGADGTPRSPRFDDIYRPAGHGLDQARHVFLAGCGLPQAWAGQPQWRILETGFGLGLNFLAAWDAWRADSQRPRLLHYVSIEAWPVSADDLVRSASTHPQLGPLAMELAEQWYGLLPGMHRLAFEGGRVLLTLCVGDVHEMLRQQSMQADSVFLDGFDPQRNPQMWTAVTMKAVARLCRRGARAATWTVAADVRSAMGEAGFNVEKADGLAPKRHCLRAVFDPAWEPKRKPATEVVHAIGRCAVIGAGLAGAAVAASLSHRGWDVTVFDGASQPASGASELPAGLMAPHQSPDDNPLSKLTRAGIRITLQQAQSLLEPGRDWSLTGALEHRLDDARPLPPLGNALDPWTRLASDEEKAAAGLPETANAWWHERAAWIRPAALVKAWLGCEGIQWCGKTRVGRLERKCTQWALLAPDDAQIGVADLVVVAAAHASAGLLGGRVDLTPVRGQISWWLEPPEPVPPFPVNGNGHFLPRVPIDEGIAWLSGSTYGRGDEGLDVRTRDHAANFERLSALVPRTAASLERQFADGHVRAWTGVRCASRDRRPVVGPVEDGLWVSTAMGSRGLTFAALCAELLAARLQGEPLPLEPQLAAALAVERQR